VTAPLWTAAEAAAATGGRASGWDAVSGIAIDSREVAPGDLFVALPGERADGHAFIADALARGAAAAMVAHRPEDLPGDAPLLEVADTMAGLRALARAARARAEARVVAVTGSVGKTTTKEMLAAMLGAQGRVHAATRSFNNHVGVPLTLARMPADADWAVIEIGMNHANEIRPLARLARPHVAVITTVQAVHLENFDSVAGIADAKAEILEGLVEGGAAVLNRDNPWFDRLAGKAAGARVLSFGEAGADVRLARATIRGETTVMEAALGDRPVFCKIGAPGLHLAECAIAALGACLGAGADPARAALGLARWRPPARRGERHRVPLGPGGMDGEIVVIDESYNASPASVRAALAVLAAAEVTDDIGRIARGRRIAFLGDMLELGPDERALHAAIAELPELAGVDVVHCCGPLMRALHEALPREKRGVWTGEGAALAERARRLVDAGDVCVVKGSNAMGLDGVVAAIRALGTADPALPEGDA
jgi:UDP-N-acetylmuramoyl-tripeptide--D-alanyl-D-alanine ligase